MTLHMADIIISLPTEFYRRGRRQLARLARALVVEDTTRCEYPEFSGTSTRKKGLVHLRLCHRTNTMRCAQRCAKGDDSSNEGSKLLRR
mmetsp:Transcript_18849/g.42213  ORF Transcript_18849/g.42213 Transcript_18849/m.42213 type:complete len:89 (+) Transcript_18849:534-800(+)